MDTGKHHRVGYLLIIQHRQQRLAYRPVGLNCIVDAIDFSCGLTILWLNIVATYFVGAIPNAVVTPYGFRFTDDVAPLHL